jgi:diacylglycerol kinase
VLKFIAMPRPKKTTLISFRHAFDGIWYMLRTEPRVQVYLAIAVAVIGIGAWMRLTREGWFFLFFAITLVFLAEMLHTAVCACVALYTDKHQPVVSRACDMARGGALLAAVIAATILLVIFIYQPV